MTAALPSRVFIVEDYALLRQMLGDLVARTQGLELCGATGSAEEALQRLPDARADLMLIDVSLPGKSGIELVAEMRQRNPEVLCVMLSGHRSSEYARMAREAGARGYVAKSEVYDLAHILRAVLDGGSHFATFE